MPNETTTDPEIEQAIEPQPEEPKRRGRRPKVQPEMAEAEDAPKAVAVEENCGTCACWRQVLGVHDPRGECHRYPQPTTSHKVYRCYEWRPKTEDQG